MRGNQFLLNEFNFKVGPFKFKVGCFGELDRKLGHQPSVANEMEVVEDARNLAGFGIKLIGDLGFEKEPLSGSWPEAGLIL